MVTFKTSLGLLNIEPKEYKISELNSLLIRQFNLEFPYRELKELRAELISKGYIKRILIPRKLVRFVIQQVFRVSKVRMYYAEEIKGETPTPFAELRAVVFTMNPEGWEARLDKALDRLEWMFYTIEKSLNNRKITAKIVGLEVEPVDMDEVTAPLDQIQRYFGVYNTKKVYRRTHKKYRMEYDETKIATEIEPARMTEYKGWISKKSEEGKLKPELEEKHKKLSKE